jgi:hypothetical protein
MTRVVLSFFLYYMRYRSFVQSFANGMLLRILFAITVLTSLTCSAPSARLKKMFVLSLSQGIFFRIVNGCMSCYICLVAASSSCGAYKKNPFVAFYIINYDDPQLGCA